MPNGKPEPQALEVIARLADEIAALRTTLEHHEPTLTKLLAELERSPDLAEQLRDALAVADPDRLYTAAEMSGRLHVLPATIRRWCRDGRIVEARKVGAEWLMPANVTVLPTAHQAGKRKPHRPATRWPRASTRGPSTVDEAGLAALQALKQGSKRQGASHARRLSMPGPQRESG